MEPSRNGRSRSEPPVEPADQRGHRSRRGQGQISGEGVPPIEIIGYRRARSTGPTSRRMQGTTCGGCSEAVGAGHRVVRQPCGHVYHERCVIDCLERNSEYSVLVCGANGCGLRYPRRQSTAAAIQADAGLRRRAERMIRGIGDTPTVDGMLYFPWDQNSPGIGLPLDNISVNDLKLRFETVKEVKSWLATRHARIQTHVISSLNKALAESRAGQTSATPVPLLKAIKLWYLTPALLHYFDGRVAPKARYKSLERGDISQVLPWLIEYTRAAATRHRGTPDEQSEDQRFKRASAACRHAGGIKDTARVLLAEPRSPGSEDTWTRLQAKFPFQDSGAIDAAIAEALLESETAETVNTPRWRPEQEFNPHTLTEVANSRSANSGAGNDRQRFAHIKSIANTVVGREEFFYEASKL